MNEERYAYIGEDRFNLMCRDCSTRSNGVLIPADEHDDHEIWHEYLDFVLKGVALLDQKVPDWRTRINTQDLDLEVGSDCIIGQVFREEYASEENREWWHAGTYFFGCHQLGVEPSAAYRYGFDASQIRDISNQSQYRLLREHWLWQVTA